jgi:hypothetical protein
MPGLNRSPSCLDVVAGRINNLEHASIGIDEEGNIVAHSNYTSLEKDTAETRDTAVIVPCPATQIGRAIRGARTRLNLR